MDTPSSDDNASLQTHSLRPFLNTESKMGGFANVCVKFILFSFNFVLSVSSLIYILYILCIYSIYIV